MSAKSKYTRKLAEAQRLIDQAADLLEDIQNGAEEDSFAACTKPTRAAYTCAADQAAQRLFDIRIART